MEKVMECYGISKPLKNMNRYEAMTYGEIHFTCFAFIPG